MPSRKRMRPINISACFISSMACFSKAWCNFSKPQLAHISECTMYMLIAVNSSASRSFSNVRICEFPFMAVSWRNDGKRIATHPQHAARQPAADVQNDTVRCLSLTRALPTECLVLVLEPGECVVKMLRIKVRPIFIPDVEIRIHRLHWEKTAQSAGSAPANDQIQA